MERPAHIKRMLSFLLFAKGAILMILTAVVALRAEWLAALATLGVCVLMLLAGALVRRRSRLTAPRPASS